LKRRVRIRKVRKRQRDATLLRPVVFVEIGEGQLPLPPITARTVLAGPKSSVPSTYSMALSFERARLTRLLMVPTAHPQIAAASS